MFIIGLIIEHDSAEKMQSRMQLKSSVRPPYIFRIFRNVIESECLWKFRVNAAIYDSPVLYKINIRVPGHTCQLRNRIDRLSNLVVHDVVPSVNYAFI